MREAIKVAALAAGWVLAMIAGAVLPVVLSLAGPGASVPLPSGQSQISASMTYPNS